MKQLIIFAFFFYGCGSSDSLPTLEKNYSMGQIHSSQEALSLEEDGSWLSLCEELGLKSHHVTLTSQEEEELKKNYLNPKEYLEKHKELVRSKLIAELSQGPGFLTPQFQDRYTKKLADVTEIFQKEAVNTRCDEIVSWENWNIPGTAYEQMDSFIMGYKIPHSEEIHHALVLLPKGYHKGGLPLMAYAHEGDQGLAYPDLAKVLGKAQASYAIVAPTYPGEPLCGGGIPHEKEAPMGCSLPQGEKISSTLQTGQEAWNLDADHLLAASDALVWVLYSKDWGPSRALTPLEKDVAQILKSRGGLKLSRSLGGPKVPLMTMVGASRGGLTAAIAAAKVGAAWKAFGEAYASLKTPKAYLHKDKILAQAVAERLGEGYRLIPPAIENLIMVASPVSITVGQLRFVFEPLAKGRIEKTAFRYLSGIRKLSRLFDPYLAGEESAYEASLHVLRRDLLFLSPLLMASVRSWSFFPSQGKTQPGKIFLMHHLQDSIVPPEQMQFAANVLIHMSENPIVREKTSSNGWDLTVRLLDSPYPKQSLSSFERHLGNHFWHESHFKLPARQYFPLSTQNAYFQPMRYTKETRSISMDELLFEKRQKLLEEAQSHDEDLAASYVLSGYSKRKPFSQHLSATDVLEDYLGELVTTGSITN